MKLRKTYVTMLLTALFAMNAKAQMSDADIQQMTESSFVAFKANKWSTFENDKYWGWQAKDENGEVHTGYRYYWEQALCTMALEQQAEYGTSVDAKLMVAQNLDGFITKYGTGYGLGWNDYIDDIGWVLDAFAVGYRITGDTKYLNAAIRMWNVGFIRGNLGPDIPYANTVKDGSEGLWWRVPHGRYMNYDAQGLNGKEGNGEVVKNQDHYKSPLATNPHVSGGAYLYKFTGESRYLDAAEKMWQWEVNTLWEFDDDSGIHEGYDPYRPQVTDKDGNTQAERPEGLRSRRTMHDLSSFFEGTNALWKATGKEVYRAWCWKIINSVLYHRLNNNIIVNKFDARDGSWCWEAGRAWTMFVADNDLWDFKGQVPLIEGTYTDYTGTEKTYTTKVQGTLKSIPNGWTLYQFMANSAKEIRGNNGTCIILPTNRQMKNPWTSAPGANYMSRMEAETNDGTTVKWTQVASSGMTIKASNSDNVSGGKYVGYLGKGNYIEFFYTPEQSGIFDVAVAYCTGSTRTIDISLNGTKVYTMTCNNTGDWTTPFVQSVSGLLMEKDKSYTLRLYNDTGDMPNLDYVSILATQKIDNLADRYYLYNVGQKMYVKTGKGEGYDMPGLVSRDKAVAQVITPLPQQGGTGDGSTWLIASPDFAAGWGVQGRNTIYETNNGSAKTNSWGTSITPGWTFEKTGEQLNGYDVVYLKYTWGNYTKGNTNVTDPANKTFVLHYGSYDLSTDGWNDTQKADVANPWCYGGLESNLDSYGNDAKWLLIPMLDERTIDEELTSGEQLLATLSSLDEKNTVYVCQNEGDNSIYYRMERDGKMIINNSSLGMNTNQGDFTRGLTFTGATTRTVNETYKMYTGKAANYTDHCQETTLTFTKAGTTVKMDVVVRAYDDGVAYRYYFYGKTLTDGNFRVNSDNSRVVVNTFKRCWGQKWTYDYSQGMGHAFSWEEAQQLANDLDGQDAFGTGCFAAPLMIQSALGDDYFVLISDGAVDQWFCRGVLHAAQTAGSVGDFGFLLRGEKNNGVGVSTKCPVYTPWRCAVVGSLKTIAETTMFENVTDATQPDPTGQNWSWVKGGFHTWDWGCTENNTSAFKNLTDDISNAKKYIDFNAKVGFKYYTLDDGWRSCKYNGSTENYVKEIVKYAKSKGQEVWLWQASGNWSNDLQKLTDNFKTFKDYGVVGCKIDFFYDGDTRGVMQKMERIAEAAAENGLMINYHGCPTPTGLRRKWPNIVSYEAVDGNEDYFTGGWNNTGTDPGYNGLLSIMRNAVGPMDYTICEFRSGNNGSGGKRTNTSWAQQLSEIVCFESGNQWFSDALENVQNEPNIIDAIKDAPTTWDESHCLYAWVGDETVKDIQGNEDANFRVVWARRNGRNWYVGGSTNPAWTYTLDCSFLGDGTYKATIFKDGASQDVVAKEVKYLVTSSSQFSISCLDRGGFYVRFEPSAEEGNTDELYYIYNVGAKQWIKTGGQAKTPDAPGLTDAADRTQNVITPLSSGYIICDPEFAPEGWGVQGRNTIYESNNGSVRTNSWGTTLIPGWKFTPTGDKDGSVYIEYTWDTWTKGNLTIDDPSDKTYSLFYGDWALGTNGWSDIGKADVTGNNKTGVWPDLQANRASHGDYAKWLIIPVGNGTLNGIATVLRGDVNSDGYIDNRDLTAIVSHLLSRPVTGRFSEQAADLNYDGNIDISDVAELVSIIKK